MKSILILLLLLASCPSFAIDLVVTFDPAATYADGSTLDQSEISKYELCIDDCSSVMDVVSGQVFSDLVQLNSVPSLRVRTVLKSGIVSEWSEPTSVNLFQPGPPTNLRIEISIKIVGQ